MRQFIGDHDHLPQHVLLTICAIIQAVALAELLKERLPIPSTGWNPAEGLQTIAVLQILILTLHEYMISTLGLPIPRRAFGLVDTYVPFGLGVCEVKLSQVFENHNAWCIWFGIFWILGFVAFLNAYIKVDQIEPNCEMFGRHFRLLRTINLAGAAAFAVFFLTLPRFLPLDKAKTPFFVGVNLLLLSWAVRSRFVWNDLKAAPACEYWATPPMNSEFPQSLILTENGTAGRHTSLDVLGNVGPLHSGSAGGSKRKRKRR